VTLALDTDVLVAWTMGGAPSHRAVRVLLEGELAARGGRIGVLPQVLHEFLHVTTDPKRFQAPLAMADALSRADRLWNARDVVRIVPGPAVVPRTLRLMEELRLGRKRILDTAIAATLEAAGVTRLATLNAKDYRVFPFLDPVEP
jgi:predicted nucleic acid-binding protein